MAVGAGLYMYVVVVQKFTFATSSPDEFLFNVTGSTIPIFVIEIVIGFFRTTSVRYEKLWLKSAKNQS